jgi:hypothetical protein
MITGYSDYPSGRKSFKRDFHWDAKTRRLVNNKIGSRAFFIFSRVSGEASARASQICGLQRVNALTNRRTINFQATPAGKLQSGHDTHRVVLVALLP